MDARDVVAIGASAVLVVQLIKFGFPRLPKRYTPWVVVAVSLVFETVWIWAQGWGLEVIQPKAFDLLAGLAGIVATSAGVYGFIKEPPETLMTTGRAPQEPKPIRTEVHLDGETIARGAPRQASSLRS